MKFKILPMLLALSVLPASTVWADDEIETGQVVISASRIEQQIDDVSANIEVITAEDLEKMGITSLDTFFGMQMNMSNPGSASIPSIRSMGGDYTLFLIDGRKVTLPQRHGADHLIESININNIERIEIIRGAAATMYGSDAMGGVINIITKKGAEPSGAISASITNQAISTSYNYDFGRVGNWTGKIDANISETMGNSYTSYSVASATGDVTESTSYYGRDFIKSFGGSIGYYITDNIDVLASYSYRETRDIVITDSYGGSSTSTDDPYYDYVGEYLEYLVDKTYNFKFHNASIDLQGSLGGHQFSLTPWLSGNMQYGPYSPDTSLKYLDYGVNALDTFVQ